MRLNLRFLMMKEPLIYNDESGWEGKNGPVSAKRDINKFWDESNRKPIEESWLEGDARMIREMFSPMLSDFVNRKK